MLAAAHRQFLERGFASTTLAAVADEASVSVETVYKAFANKAGLLKAVFDVAIAGDDEPVALVEREWVHRIQAEPDPCRKLALFGDHIADAGRTTAHLQLLARDAAASDAAAAGVWEQMLTEKVTGMGLFAAHLHEGGHLRRDVSSEEATDVLVAFLSPSRPAAGASAGVVACPVRRMDRRRPRRRPPPPASGLTRPSRCDGCSQCMRSTCEATRGFSGGSAGPRCRRSTTRWPGERLRQQSGVPGSLQSVRRHQAAAKQA